MKQYRVPVWHLVGMIIYYKKLSESGKQGPIMLAHSIPKAEHISFFSVMRWYDITMERLAFYYPKIR